MASADNNQMEMENLFLCMGRCRNMFGGLVLTSSSRSRVRCNITTSFKFANAQVLLACGSCVC